MNSFDECTPSAFDTLITDISAETLKTDISDQLKRKYLAPLEEQGKQIEEIRSGIIYGASYRAFFSIPTRYKNNKPIWIYYLVDTGAPKTYLAKQVLTLKQSGTCIFINGKETVIGISSHRFECVNILGMDFLMKIKQLKYCLPGMDQQSVFRNHDHFVSGELSDLDNYQIYQDTTPLWEPTKSKQDCLVINSYGMSRDLTMKASPTFKQALEKYLFFLSVVLKNKWEYNHNSSQMIRHYLIDGYIYQNHAAMIESLISHFKINLPWYKTNFQIISITYEISFQLFQQPLYQQFGCL